MKSRREARGAAVPPWAVVVTGAGVAAPFAALGAPHEAHPAAALLAPALYGAACGALAGLACGRAGRRPVALGAALGLAAGAAFAAAGAWAYPLVVPGYAIVAALPAFLVARATRDAPGETTTLCALSLMHVSLVLPPAAVFGYLNRHLLQLPDDTVRAALLGLAGALSWLGAAGEAAARLTRRPQIHRIRDFPRGPAAGGGGVEAGSRIMDIVASKRVRSIGGYAFAEVDREVEKLRAAGVAPVDFGVGDPTDPTPEVVREACKRAVDEHARSGYPSYIGAQRYREAVSAWMKRRFGVDLDPATEIASTIGSKEGVFHFHEGFVDPGDIVLCPNPGYPPYYRGTLFAEGEPWPVAMRASEDFLPDLERIPADVVRRAKVLWINYPNSPSGKVAPPEYLERAVAFCRRRGIILCSDEAYSEIYFTPEAPRSALEFGKEGVLVFQSLSKRSAMTGYRVGFVAGDRRIVEVFKKVKTNIDSGTPNFVQEAAIAALSDEAHVAAMREEYRRRRDALVEGLAAAGLERCVPEGTIYLWQHVPHGVTSVELAKRLLAPEVAIVCTPGAWISQQGAEGENPGEGYVRFALVPSLDDTRTAAARLARGVAEAKPGA